MQRGPIVASLAAASAAVFALAQPAATTRPLAPQQSQRPTRQRAEILPRPDTLLPWNRDGSFGLEEPSPTPRGEATQNGRAIIDRPLEERPGGLPPPDHLVPWRTEDAIPAGGRLTDAPRDPGGWRLPSGESYLQRRAAERQRQREQQELDAEDEPPVVEGPPREGIFSSPSTSVTPAPRSAESDTDANAEDQPPRRGLFE